MTSESGVGAGLLRDQTQPGGGGIGGMPQTGLLYGQSGQTPQEIDKAISAGGGDDTLPSGTDG